LGRFVPDHGQGAVDVLFVGDPDVHHRPGPAPGHVADHLDLAVGHDVDRALDIAQDDHPEGHLLHRPALPSGLDHVPDGELVLEQDEEAREEVLDQALGPERHGEAQDAGAREDRADVDEDIEGEEQGDRDHQQPPHAPEELGDGLAPALPEGGDRVVAVVHFEFDPAGGERDHPESQPGQQPDAENARAGAHECLAVDLEGFGEALEQLAERGEGRELKGRHGDGAGAWP
jgi:hypothetical protein